MTDSDDSIMGAHGNPVDFVFWRAWLVVLERVRFITTG